MKRVRIALCVALFVFLAVPASSFALTVGSPYKNGSLMIFPLVDGSDGVDTVITISNGFYETVDIACRHRTVSDEVGGFTFHLGPYQTAWFSIQTGQGSIPAPMAFAERGELKCWAVDASGGQQISWNYLQGFAQITNADGLSWGYSSWNFKANKTRNKVVGKPGIIKLSGKSGQYDAMPQYLYFSVPGTVTEAQLTLLLGKEDLRQDRQSTYSKAKFYYERGRTSGTQCLMDMVEVSIPPSGCSGALEWRGLRAPSATGCSNCPMEPPRAHRSWVWWKLTATVPFLESCPSALGPTGQDTFSGMRTGRSRK